MSTYHTVVENEASYLVKNHFRHPLMAYVEIETAFIDSDFSNAILSGGSFYRLIIKGCNFRKTSFFNTRIIMVTFEHCIWNEGRNFPDGAIESDS